jgi:hypothetical protein
MFRTIEYSSMIPFNGMLRGQWWMNERRNIFLKMEGRAHGELVTLNRDLISHYGYKLNY